MKNLVITSVFIASTLLTSTAFSAGSANIAVGSNYIWRGVTQSGDDAAISGGLDYETGNGISFGTWTSSLGGGNAYELDLYGAYGGKLGGADYSVGFTNYRYPTANNADFTEVNGSLGFGSVSFTTAYTVSSDDDTTPEFSKGDIYYSLSYTKEIKKDLSLSLTAGKYDFDNATGSDYTHYQLGLSKGDFTFAIDDNDLTNSDPRVSVSWSKSLDL